MTHWNISVIACRVVKQFGLCGNCSEFFDQPCAAKRTVLGILKNLNEGEEKRTLPPRQRYEGPQYPGTA